MDLHVFKLTENETYDDLQNPIELNKKKPKVDREREYNAYCLLFICITGTIYTYIKTPIDFFSSNAIRFLAHDCEIIYRIDNK